MSHLRDLYQEVIVDHNRNPRHYHVMDNPTGDAEGYNPLCGDKLHLYIKIENGVITDASFQCQGCAISTASASLMTDSLIGKTEAEANALFEQFHRMVTENDSEAENNIGKLAVLAGVKEFPARVKCATLAWHTLNAALNNCKDVVSTE